MLTCRKRGLSLSKATTPNFSLIPYSTTMLRAISVALIRSFWAPVETSSKTISSATLPPKRQVSLFRSSDLLIR